MKHLTEEEWRHALLNIRMGAAKYPWRLWLDGNPHLIERGIDYTVTDKTFRKNVYRKQVEFGPVWCLTHPDGFLIKAGKPNDSQHNNRSRS